jgi:hypothetical protein
MRACSRGRSCAGRLGRRVVAGAGCHRFEHRGD